MYGKCIDWVKKSALHGDAYYGAATAWSHFRKGSLATIKALATVYRKSLDKSLACLRKLSPSPAVKRQVELTENYKEMLADDVVRLEKMNKSLLPHD
jgi:hypothetical protein